MKQLKIVHCSIFNENENGNFFYGLERKISHGLIRNGHFVYDFSYRDWERNLRFLGIKNSGLKSMNDKLFEICKNIKADILLIGKAEKIELNTLKRIKSELSNIKIVQWYVDHLQENSEFFEKFNTIDTFFHANALHLQRLSNEYKNTVFSFFPNISDSAFDKFKQLPKVVDVIYIARDYKEDVRHKFATLLDEFCKKNSINHKIYASLGNNSIFGDEFNVAVNSAKIAINFNRDDELECKNANKLLGASDRMAQFMGCGACTFSPQIAGFEKLFEPSRDIVYFNSVDDCFKKIKEYLKDDKYTAIAEQGRQKALKIVNATRVSKFMLEVAFGEKLSEDYEWSEYKFKNGAAI
ncbi:glycosyltransferase [Campylobacter sp. faydin G-24]|uniref:Glycosyltransferase n=1 Tax=Campylobacter anatolicus TaxID=2829105 RepID=A0ABS5HGM1_9BACT|nr:glycosyltransferase [Campylobacter anatolicus]